MKKGIAITGSKVLLIIGILAPAVLAILVIAEIISGASISDALTENGLFTIGAWLPLIIYFLFYSDAKKEKK